MNSDNGPFRWTPLASGTTGVSAAVILTIALMLRHSPLPDAPAGDFGKQVAGVKSGSSKVFDGVHVVLPQGWTFARYGHSPQLQSRLTVPGLGQVPVGPRRRVLFAAGRTPGSCVAILERDSIEHMDLEGDAAAIRKAAPGDYRRNVFNWATTTREGRFKQLVNTADEILNGAGPSDHTTAISLVTEKPTYLGTHAAREIGFAASLNDREKAGLLYVLAHKDRWQYALVGVVEEPPRLCTIEITWIQEHLSFD
jgi:hypothetical protein